jgi:hypothetical protein
LGWVKRRVDCASYKAKLLLVLLVKVLLVLSQTLSLFQFLLQIKQSQIRSSNLDMWHYRLGHPSYSNFHFLQDCIPNDLSNNMSHSCIDHCNVCPIAKQKHLPFPKHNKIHSTVFALIHCDVWGLLYTPAAEGCRYFLTIVDDHFRCTWVFLMKTKSESRL